MKQEKSTKEKVMNKFYELYLSISKLISVVSIACKIQLLFFATFHFFAIIISFITSISFSLPEFIYFYTLIYGGILLITFTYRFVIFAMDYISKSIAEFGLWTIRADTSIHSDKTSKIYQNYLFFRDIPFDKPFNKFMSVLSILCVNFNVFFWFIFIISLIVGVLLWGNTDKSFINSFACSYLTVGWMMVMVYFSLSNVVDFIFELIICGKKVKELSISTLIAKFLPCSFVFDIFNHILFRKKQKVKTIHSLFWCILEGIFLCGFIGCFVLLTIHEKKNGGRMWGYWVLFTFTIISGLSHSNRYLRIKRKKYEQSTNESLTPMPKMMIDMVEVDNRNSMEMNTQDEDQNQKKKNQRTVREVFGDEENPLNDVDLQNSLSSFANNETTSYDEENNYNRSIELYHRKSSLSKKSAQIKRVVIQNTYTPFNLMNKLRKYLFGFKYERSLLMMTVMTVVFVVVTLLIIFCTGSIRTSLTKSTVTQTMNGDMIEENEISNQRAYSSVRTFLTGLLNSKRLRKQNEEFHKKLSDEIVSEQTRKYSHLCSTDPFGITPIEYLYLSHLAYKNDSDEDENETITSESFNGTNEHPFAKYEKHYINNLIEKGWEMKYYNIQKTLFYSVSYRKDLNVKVISFRGTYTAEDTIHDIQLFLESSSPQLSLFIFPIFTNDVLLYVADIVSLFGSKAFSKGSLILAKLAEEAVIQEQAKDSIPIVLTGHSLGGGVANIVASKLGIVSFAVSPPGVYLATNIYGMEQDNINVLLRSVVPERDPVSSLGVNGGQIMSIPCYEDDSFGCHTLKHSECTISHLCHIDQNDEYCVEEWERWKIDVSWK